MTEAIITLSLIAILSAIAVPQLGSLVKNFRLKGATSLVCGDLENAKVTAIKENRSIRIDFNSTSYNFTRVDTGKTILTRNLAEEYPNITVAKDGGGSITFGSTGLTQSATITVQGPAGVKIITVIWTGRIKTQ